MLLDHTELGLLWEPLPTEIKYLICMHPPSYLYFYETDPVLEFVWRWKRRNYIPKNEELGYMVDYEKYEYQEASAAWYIGNQYRIQCQLIQWDRFLTPKAFTPSPKFFREAAFGGLQFRVGDEDGRLENTGYKRVPFDRVSAHESLRHVWNYLSRTDQLDALLW